MVDKMTLDEKVDRMMIDLASVKTDITWLKRLFFSGVVLTGAFFGIDMSGMVM